MTNNSIRLFVAAALPEGIKQDLLTRLTAFTHPAIRFVPSANLHLTLYFIGNVSQDQLPDISEKIKTITQQHQAFILSLERLEPGPTARNPRLVWARFNVSRLFEQLQHALATALAPKPPEKQKAIPHVTLARYRKSEKNIPAFAPVLPPEQLLLPVNEVSLWQSELASPHPVYSILDSWPLLQNPGPANKV